MACLSLSLSNTKPRITRIYANITLDHLFIEHGNLCSYSPYQIVDTINDPR